MGTVGPGHRRMPFLVNMTDLAEPLLCTQLENMRACSALQLRVMRHSASQFTVASENGDVLFHLHKPKPFNPFCGLEWHLSDGISAGTSAVTVKRPLLSSSTSFDMAAGSQLTVMTQKMCCPHSEFAWEGYIYRWDAVGAHVPLQLQLSNAVTGQHVASLEGSVSMPWSKLQQLITILGGRDDPVWLQVVIASGLAEAKRLGGEHSSTTPRRFAQV